MVALPLFHSFGLACGAIMPLVSGCKVFLLEGYGVTECAPVVAVNVPMACRIGSVGQLVPGMEYVLEPVPGIAQGGALHVKGPNVMKGYLLYDQPGVIQPPTSIGEGWYATGDIVEFDADDFIHIRGRVKRFAKIAGEMISLEVVERLAAEAAPGFMHAASTRAVAAIPLLGSGKTDYVRLKEMAAAVSEGTADGAAGVGDAQRISA